MPPLPDFVRELPGAVTVCDLEGKILYMNDAAQRTFAEGGGALLVGRNLLDCHPGPARAKLEALLASGGTNAYTIEKRGIRKLIYQTPWFDAGRRAGMVELSLVLPSLPLPHFVRGGTP